MTLNLNFGGRTGMTKFGKTPSLATPAGPWFLRLPTEGDERRTASHPDVP
jgi:hypothetical protein